MQEIKNIKVKSLFSDCIYEGDKVLINKIEPSKSSVEPAYKSKKVIGFYAFGSFRKDDITFYAFIVKSKKEIKQHIKKHSHNPDSLLYKNKNFEIMAIKIIKGILLKEARTQWT